MSSALALKMAALLGSTGVAFGAFGAHGLKKIVREPEKISAWTSAAHYQLFHSAALLAFAATGRRSPYVVGLWTAGTVMFAGSIYCLVLRGERLKFLGPVTPLGGVCMIGGWLALLAL
ncbi:hypothetical protein GGI12_002072 [Dipsacomyces acuminosporus]|nr:hypothetical protein GGI12_002072 [Dipsacomyces acuminosporus]